MIHMRVAKSYKVNSHTFLRKLATVEEKFNLMQESNQALVPFRRVALPYQLTRKQADCKARLN